MCKKLVSLFLLLALANFASAATWYWNSQVAEGDWNQASNWSSSSTSIVATTVPGTGNQTYACPTAQGNSWTDVTIDIPAGYAAVSGKLQAKNLIVTWNIPATASLTNDGTVGSTEIFNNTAATVNVSGTFAMTGGATFKFGGSGSSSGPTETININSGGLMSLHNSTNNLQLMLGTYGTGTDIINVYANGELDTDTWVFTTQAATTKQIKIYTGGKMVVLGNQTGTADLNTKIIAGDAAALVATYDGTKTTFQVPEPATIALLGLGGLLLRRKK